MTLCHTGLYIHVAMDNVTIISLQFILYIIVGGK